MKVFNDDAVFGLEQEYIIDDTCDGADFSGWVINTVGYRSHANKNAPRDMWCESDEIHKQIYGWIKNEDNEKELIVFSSRGVER